MEFQNKSDFLAAVTLRPATIDDLSSIRYVHMTSFRILAAEHHSENEIQARVEDILRTEYFEEILEADLYCAIVDNEIVGTGGWCPADDNGATARIRKIFVRPLFTGCGIGRLLVEAAEERARRAGFNEFTTRANINSVAFFEHMNFEISSYGVMPTRSGVDLPVAFMRKRSAVQLQEQMQKRKLTPVSRDGWWSH